MVPDTVLFPIGIALEAESVADLFEEFHPKFLRWCLSLDLLPCRAT
jgi:hypothetical protein